MVAARAKLPAYMVPSAIVKLAELPRLASGKVCCLLNSQTHSLAFPGDSCRHALPHCFTRECCHLQVARGALPRSELVHAEVEYVAPRNSLEEAVHAAWMATLRLSQPVSIHSNFFEVPSVTEAPCMLSIDTDSDQHAALLTCFTPSHTCSMLLLCLCAAGRQLAAGWRNAVAPPGHTGIEPQHSHCVAVPEPEHSGFGGSPCRQLLV